MNAAAATKKWKAALPPPSYDALSTISSSSTEPTSLGQRYASGCWPGFSPENNDQMSTCCWYGKQTCCSPMIAGHILPVVKEQLGLIHKNGTSDKCYIALADLLCLWCSANTAQYIEGDRTITISLCVSVCQKLWDSCHDQQKKLGISPEALTPRQLCAAIAYREEDDDTPEGSVYVTIAPDDSTRCYGGVSLSVVENSGCLPDVSSTGSSLGPSGGAVAAMIVVPFLVIGLTIVAVVVYFRMVKSREIMALGGPGGGDEFSLPADAFGEEEGVLLDEDSEGSSGGRGLLGEEESM